MDKQTVTKLIEKHHNKLNVNKKMSFSCEFLGKGENNTNYLVKTPERNFIIRIARKKELYHLLKSEFDILHHIPKGIGPTPIAYDSSTGKPIVLLSYIEGQLLTQWSEHHIRSYLKSLAQLHEKRFPYYDREKRRGKMTIKEHFLKGLRSWINDCKELFEHRTVQKISKYVLNHVEQAQPLFDHITSYSIIHSDACMTNVVFNKKKAFLIDWEWATYGDSARDLALLSTGNYTLKPWYLKMNEEKFKWYVKQYTCIRHEKNLYKRALIWRLIQRYFDLIYVMDIVDGGYDKDCALPLDKYKEGKTKMLHVFEKEMKQK